MRIVLTRDPERADGLAERLRARGHDVSCVPLTRVEDGVPFPDPSRFDGVLFTSANAVARVPAKAPWPRVGAVGEATAEALRARGIAVDVVGAGGGKELAAAWGGARGQRLLLPQAEEAHGDLGDALRAAGAEVVAVAVYRTVAREGVDRGPFERADLVCFFAPSQVRAYRALAVPTRARFWGVGPTTRAAMEGLPQVADLPT
ncbi:MAG TPA: uroporphyrinogen-III synthase [Planctomycetota bacterium]|nr:uroporphyrinogen-III synthase [Planctomycetota bacterium]